MGGWRLKLRGEEGERELGLLRRRRNGWNKRGQGGTWASQIGRWVRIGKEKEMGRETNWEKSGRKLKTRKYEIEFASCYSNCQ